MEETVWVYFGIIMVIVALGIIVSVYRSSSDESVQATYFQSIGQIESQLNTVCSSPKDTQLSLRVNIPAGAVLTTADDKVCGVFRNATRCAPSPCLLEPAVVLNLTAAGESRLFTSRMYTCAFLRQDTVRITCQG
jgi:hypothetical protein